MEIVFECVRSKNSRLNWRVQAAVSSLKLVARFKDPTRFDSHKRFASSMSWAPYQQDRKQIVAYYKHLNFLKKSDAKEYDLVYPPGHATPYSGIYRCEGCAKELVSEEKKPLPPQNHHQHTSTQGNIRWQLIVYADHKPS
jgi:hypothetical protein